MAAQAIPQDIVTIILGIPLLLIALFFSRKGLIKGRLLLTGTLAYFLYTYTSYAFLCMYNQFFIIYVMLMSASLFAFVLSMLSFDIEKLKSNFSEKFPVKFVGGFVLFCVTFIGLMWLKLILTPLLNGSVPTVLEHYTTLVIQVMDLGFIVPSGIIAGILLIKKRPFGYLLASVITIKAITMLSAMTAMIIRQIIAGANVDIVMSIVIPIFNLTAIFSFYIIMKNVKEPITK